MEECETSGVQIGLLVCVCVFLFLVFADIFVRINDINYFGVQERMERAVSNYHEITHSLDNMTHCQNGAASCLGCKKLEDEKNRMRDVAEDAFSRATDRIRKYRQSPWRFV